MKMFTASIQNLIKLRKTYQNALYVCIANGTNCKKQCDIVCSELVPQWSIVQKFKNGGDWSDYVKEYHKQLEQLDKCAVFKKLKYYAEQYNKDCIVLVCYEKSNEYCHRRLIAEWYNACGSHVEEIN